MSAIDGKIILSHNPCYQQNDRMIPKGIVVHSTGANNPNLKRYIAPDDGIIGKNEYGNDWNRSSEDVCVHAFIGKDKNGVVRTYQTLPFDMCCWGCGGGYNGSFNYDPAYIQFEMCEDDLTSESYCKAVYDKAVEFCVYLCKRYNLSPSKIVSHREASSQGYASQHGDPHNWWDRFGYTMDGFRKAVRDKLTTREIKVKSHTTLYLEPYKDPVGNSSKKLNIGAGTTLVFNKDIGGGWSKVAYKNKTYYVLNGNLMADGLSKLTAVRLKTNRYARIVCVKKGITTLGKAPRKIKKGTVITVICLIKKGKYKGYKLISVGSKHYYLKSK